jgi:nitrile hydratase subunit beta
MNGVHDMGGMHGFGPVEPEPDEPVFHADWERRTFALNVVMGASGEWNLDMSRWAIEDRAPGDYLQKSYYERWLARLERLLTERGLVMPDEIAAGHALQPSRPVKRILADRDVERVLGRTGTVEREPSAPPRFAIGDRVRAKNINPRTHTRLPRYARGHLGTVQRVHGCHVLPDSRALGGERAEWLYVVAFEARELWGPEAEPSCKISIDAWECYLDPA